MRWPFAKYVGSGNDFIVFDNRQKSFPATPDIIRFLCHRQWGIGADGVLLLESSTCADVRMRILNADGSEAEMCGNGIRCFLKFLFSQGFQSLSYRIETLGRLVQASHHDGWVRVEMGQPTNIQWHLSLSLPIDHIPYGIHFLNTGVPHLVCLMDNIDAFDLSVLGPFLRHHSYFSPKGTNVNIVERIDNQSFKIRTYERGVEGETLACGTGATASALAAAFHFQLQGPLSILTKSGDQLLIDFHRNGKDFSEIAQMGPALCVYHGEIELPIEKKSEILKD